ncbi:LysM peptidoglycan-binding domain-containing protein [Nocardia sp. CDC159]|uniref:LysM peptidoglycan-binding domain-containing protein n=1 Tax=Nocardia pulmonis TaxID=2951408 RepID=A0A9X2IXU5_9NOCA|nr:MULTISPECIES: LysM peptidoglycan-binding domain-containing protein [Nocardia]MCM6774250.1 LysM peptidoglycan-binding domain-containing protein [Nocardia pulmonis]MCM6787137.1 LysM peptidoglycan-binding domain-containing protein [Nocardia sp. CDC159]
MRTPISEFVSADADLGFDSIPRAQRASVVALPCAVRTDRRPRRSRPAGAAIRYDRMRLRAVAGERDRGPHPMQRVERARVGFATLAVAALLSAVAVCGLVGAAHLRSAGTGSGSTTVVQVQEGESLSEVAARVAPEAPVRDTVRKIVELNGLRGAEVATGRTLIVPTSAD